MLANRSMPSCTVISELDYDDVTEAVDWLCAAFGFTERWRAEGHRASCRLGTGPWSWSSDIAASAWLIVSGARTR